MTSDDMAKDEETLRKAATKGKWSEVLEMYSKQRELRTSKITETGDTILHMAVSTGKEQMVESLVDIACGKRSDEDDENLPLMSSVDENGSEQKHVLGAKNDEGNTPLHLAASKGSVEMCKKIGRADPSLINALNNAGETPLFMAAFHGHKNAFLLLHYLYVNRPQASTSDVPHYKRKDNDTILHCAIAGGHIDFAIDIVLLYKHHLKDMNRRNKNGLSPLHLLAATPSAFKSTDLLGRSFLVKLIYHCFLGIKEKKQATTMEELEKHERIPVMGPLMQAFCDCIFYPDESYCVVWICNQLFGSLLRVLVLILAVIPLVMLEILLSLAGRWFRWIREMKEKHTWSLQIMEQLLEHDPYEYEIKTMETKEDKEAGSIIVETPLMIAAKNGVIEMVENILDTFPAAMKVVNEEGKNIVLLAAEKRQTRVYQCLRGYEYLDINAFRRVDNDGNTALHWAAKLGTNLKWQTTTMIDEYKWFEYVKKSIPPELWEIPNKDGETAEEIFISSYEEQMTRDREWLNQTSEACSVVSTLVASIAFPNVAENFDGKNNLSLWALSLSLTSTISFLGVLAFRSQSLNFWRWVPFMLHIAIFGMFGSIVCLWISLMFHGKSLIYSHLGLPIASLTIVSLPIFIGPTLKSWLSMVPAPSRKTTSAIRYRRPQKKESGSDSDRNQERKKNLTFRANDPLQDTERSERMKEALHAFLSDLFEMESQLKNTGTSPTTNRATNGDNQVVQELSL